ncbi:11348_t:CDS:2 [Paraglomus brasilianum]|uniref:11348_t:CDS:1 n=1 Tax=Paraglomus brasilianum TaxID=144538 RepID=A0A9N9EE45_9GLOM|nr:11348_t:CDS:2 [Paraglomus brasilianum]
MAAILFEVDSYQDIQGEVSLQLHIENIFNLKKAVKAKLKSKLKSETNAQAQQLQDPREKLLEIHSVGPTSKNRGKQAFLKSDDCLNLNFHDLLFFFNLT